MDSPPTTLGGNLLGSVVAYTRAPHRTILYSTLTYRFAAPHQDVSFRTASHYTAPYHTEPYHTIPQFTTPHQKSPHHTTHCHVAHAIHTHTLTGTSCPVVGEMTITVSGDRFGQMGLSAAEPPIPGGNTAPLGICD